MAENDESPTLVGAVTGPWREPPGQDLSRILALSDGVFAFAMTLLVLNLTGLAFLTCGSATNAHPCDESYLLSGLSNSIPAFIGYATVFFIVALYWTIHHRTFRYIERYDSGLMWLNITFLIFIAATPFNLEVYNTFNDTAGGAIYFACTSAVTGLLMASIFRHASGKAKLVDPRLPERVRHYFRLRGLILPTVFLLTVPIALYSPSLAAYGWLAAFPASLLLHRYGTA